MDSLVSVIIPIYNMEKSIETTVESIKRQDYPSIEIILVDDGSTDNSYEVCRKISITDDRIRCFHIENCGSGPARNYGIEQAKGEYLYFPDADDYIEPEAIRIMLSATVENTCDLVVFGFKSVNNKGACIKEKSYVDSIQGGDSIRNNYADYMSMDWKWGIQGAPWNKLFKKSIVVENGILFPPLRRHQDEGFISRYMCFVQKVHFIPDILYTYYSNDLNKEWEKYPVNYIESVVGLYNIRKQTILMWNSSDVETRRIVERSYINSFIKAMELSFSPKMNLSRGNDRIIWIKDTIAKNGFDQIKKPEGLGRYQMLICCLVSKRLWHLLLFVMKIKIITEQTGLLSLIKKF